MLKNQNSIWINTKKTAPIDIEDFLTTIFYDKIYKKENNAIQIRSTAEYILRKIIFKDFKDTDRKVCMDSCRVSEKQYYAILSRMKSCGLIKKRNGEYLINKQFSSTLEKLKNFWESIYYKYKENHKQERVSFSNEEQEELTEKDMEDYID